jgi:hypothetical protein
MSLDDDGALKRAPRHLSLCISFDKLRLRTLLLFDADEHLIE